ncbi:ribulose-phosphate 3-epimerase [Vagococcus salmoninarum]|uniref:Ribulose-phosphate 3-epimerase n=1 Tax=Vagococcus salmoninarum TaxID=2739 RepID=A0A429ZR26_9ENTE|nr:ribulose-phosphate 3-epimerase [Vagococcus salmoninarum]MBE9387706.1 ribulose-phosphate 3-epimerase [Vagococcus salmoninarum]RST96099.1 ribulose-phosphate 3-epimerase [Vagococcus salmoninarum]
MKIAPSILSADFANLERDVVLVEKAGADYIHVDVMDGQFVPNITLGPNIVSAIRPVTKLPLDVHLMIMNPERFVDDFAKAGADFIVIHQESTIHLHRTLQMIKNAGVKAGVVINPGTPVATLKDVLSMVDLVLVMTVNPGFGGQAFIPEMTEKIAELAALRKKHNYSYEIEVDGGIDAESAKLCAQAGADVFVAGSYVYNSDSPAARIQALRDAVE